MSFNIWQERPPFAEADLTHTKDCDERIYACVDGVWMLSSDLALDAQPSQWCVSSEGLPTTQKVSALMNPRAPEPSHSEKLAEMLISKNVITALEAEQCFAQPAKEAGADSGPVS